MILHKKYILLDILISFIIYLIIISIFQAVALLIIDFHLINDNVGKLTIKQHLILSIFGTIALFILLFLRTQYFEKIKFSDLGFYNQKILKNLFFGLLLGFVLISIGLIIICFFENVDFKYIGIPKNQLFQLTLFCLLVSVHEEVLCRGFFLRYLKKSFNDKYALIISSFLFTIMHVFNPNFGILSFVNIFLAGILLGIPFLKSGNLWISIALHFSWNFFQALFGFKVSGLNVYSAFELNSIDKNFINGGDFGFEGSIICVIIQIIGIFFMLRYFKYDEI